MSVYDLSLVGTATRIALIAVSLANGIVLARVLGPGGLGQLFVFLQLVALLAVIAEAGLSHSAAAFFGRTPQAARYMHGLVLRIVPLSAIATAIIAAPVLVLVRELVLPRFPSELVWVAFASMPFAVYANVWMGMMAGLGRIVEASWVFLAGSGLWLVLTLAFVVPLRAGAPFAGTVYAVSLLAQAGVMAAVAGRLVGRPTMSAPGPGSAKGFVFFAARAYPGAIAYLLWTRMPIFLLNVFHGPAAVGVFSAAQQLVDRALLPIAAVQAATYREMSRLSRAASTLAVNRYVRFAWMAMAGVGVAGIVLADPIVQLLLGRAYHASASVSRILLPGLMFSACALLLDSYFFNQLNRPGLLSLLAGLQVLLISGLGVLLVPPLGVAGAAIALVLTQAMGTLAYIVWHLRLTETRITDLLVLTRSDLRALQRRLRLGGL